MFERIKEFLKKNKKLILIILAVILIIIIIIFSIPRKEEAPKEETPVRGADLKETVFNRTELSEEDRAKLNADLVAKNFAEIYGSYSNQSNYNNIENALPLMSADYKKEMENYLRLQRVSFVLGDEYKGVTTVAIGSTTEYLDNNLGKTTIVVKTQKKESVGTQSNYTIKYQDLRINLVKEGDNWLVEGVNWID